MSHRIAVKLRGTQTELYNLGYAAKGSLNPAQPYNIWPGEEGHFEINMVDEFALARCLEAYEVRVQLFFCCSTRCSLDS